MGPPIKMSGVRRTLEHSITAPVNLKSTQSLASKKKKKALLRRRKGLFFPCASLQACIDEYFQAKAGGI